MSYYRTAGILAAAIAFATTSHAQNVFLSIDPSQSTLTADESRVFLFIAGFDGAPATGGDSTSLSGSLVASLSGGGFQLMPGSSIVADDVTDQLPGIPVDDPDNAAPASFAFTFPGSDFATSDGSDFALAVRDLELSLTDTAPRTFANGEIGAGAADMTVLSGEAHLNAGSPPISDLTVQVITDVLVGPGDYSFAGNLLTVEFPIAFTSQNPENFLDPSTDDDGFTVYSGTIVATGVIPEPASIYGALVALGFGLGRRRSR